MIDFFIIYCDLVIMINLLHYLMLHGATRVVGNARVACHELGTERVRLGLLIRVLSFFRSNALAPSVEVRSKARARDEAPCVPSCRTTFETRDQKARKLSLGQLRRCHSDAQIRKLEELVSLGIWERIIAYPFLEILMRYL